jgi:uncharacterized repeat protein (TIGR03803 family)
VAAESIVYSFCSLQNCSDGFAPDAGVVADKSGNLFGTAGGGISDGGNVFELSPSGVEKVLYRFVQNGNDGWGPGGGLIRGKRGALFGTTYYGGGTGCGGDGCGTVFEISKSGAETQLHVFAGGSDGAWPLSGLTPDKEGNLYGTTANGGQAGCDNGCGTIFQVSPDGTETVLHAFNGSEGHYPWGGLIFRKSHLYGATYNGGAGNAGTVFSLDLSDGRLVVLHSFKGEDGANPMGNLLLENDALYGTTFASTTGCGTVYKITPKGKFATLYTFQGDTNNGDGCNPPGGLAWYNGNLYGTTESGGGGFTNTYGTVFELSPDGSETVLNAFQGPPQDGQEPFAGLAVVNGTLYGTTLKGGANYLGTVFSVTPP